MKKGLKRFFVSVLLVLCALLCVDYAVGKVFEWIMPRTGVYDRLSKTYFGVYSIKYPVLIIGSSRAAHHYVPEIIGDYFNEDVYNLGLDGCFFTNNYFLVNSILDRYNPKLIIWELSPGSICKSSESICELYQYYGKARYADSIINEDADWTEKVRLKSNMYKYNSKLHRVFARFVTNKSDKDELLGYRPLPEISQIEGMEIKTVEPKDIDVDFKSKKRFISIIDRLKKNNVKVLLVDSPSYYKESNSENLKFFSSLCDSLNINFIDNSQLEEFFKHPEYFKDVTHLNNKGAEIYTNIVVEQLKDLQLYIN